MIAWLVALAAAPAWGGRNPAPSILNPKAEARRLECERLTSELGRAVRPNDVRAEKARGDYVENTVLLCRQRLMRPGLRAARDEAILADLRDTTARFAAQVAANRDGWSDRTWLVEIFYPNPQVAPKIGFSAKSALMRQNLRVSDRVPWLTASDVDVLVQLPPQQAYPGACQRWHRSGQLRDDDVLLGIMTRDPRETILHAGVCTRGQWTWLQ